MGDEEDAMGKQRIASTAAGRLTTAVIAVVSVTGASVLNTAAGEERSPKKVPPAIPHDVIMPIEGVPWDTSEEERHLARGQTGVEWHSVVVVKALPPGVNEASAESNDADIAASIRGVDEYFSRETGGKIRFRLERVEPWVQVAQCNGGGAGNMWKDWANRTGTSRKVLTHYMFYIPDSTACDAPGLAEVQQDRTRGGFGYVSWPDFRGDILAHELGHNLGLLHANLVDCPGTKMDAKFTGFSVTRRAILSGDCTEQPYGDRYDIMGIGWRSSFSQFGSMSPVHFPQLDAHSSDMLEVSESGFVTISASDKPGDAPRYPTIKSPNGEMIRLEYRSETTTNSWMPGAHLGTRGLLIRREYAMTMDASSPYSKLKYGLLMNGNKNYPKDASNIDSRMLPRGETFATEDGKVKVTLMNAESGSAVAKVVVNGIEPAPAGPAVEEAPPVGKEATTVSLANAAGTGVVAVKTSRQASGLGSASGSSSSHAKQSSEVLFN